MPLAWFVEHACNPCAYIIFYNKTHWLDLFVGVCVCVIKVTSYVLHARRYGDMFVEHRLFLYAIGLFWDVSVGGCVCVIKDGLL